MHGTIDGRLMFITLAGLTLWSSRRSSVLAQCDATLDYGSVAEEVKKSRSTKASDPAFGSRERNLTQIRSD